MYSRFVLNNESRKFIELLKKLKIKCTIILTNYTIEIKTENNQFKGIKSEKPTKIFIMSKQIKKDIQNAVQLNLFELPKSVSRDAVHFYQVGNTKTKDKEVFYIDIKNAYPTVLFNHGLVSKKTFDQLMRSSKTDRLAAIGSLAARKNVFELEDGQVKEFLVIRSEWENYFWFAVRIIEEMMKELAVIAGDYFIYSWVDCIYLSGDTPLNILNEIQKIILNKSYYCTVSIGKKFSIVENERTFFVSFVDEKDKEKIFRFPKSNSEFTRVLTEAIMQGRDVSVK